MLDGPAREHGGGIAAASPTDPLAAVRGEVAGRDGAVGIRREVEGRVHRKRAGRVGDAGSAEVEGGVMDSVLVVVRGSRTTSRRDPGRHPTASGPAAHPTRRPKASSPTSWAETSGSAFCLSSQPRSSSERAALPLALGSIARDAAAMEAGWAEHDVALEGAGTAWKPEPARQSSDRSPRGGPDVPAHPLTVSTGRCNRRPRRDSCR